ncbi:MAG: hypothetical protein WDK96_00320 [Candidatus Paceibacterota bacterium]|jgi:DNA polymerase III delta prime subunit
MQLNLEENNLHHAYLIEGDKNSIIPLIFDFIKSMGIETEGNGDIWYQEIKTLNIEGSHQIKARQIERGLMGGKKFFIFAIDFFTRDAEQALLKVFEEPAENVHFFIITPTTDFLLETLKSRFVLIKSDEEKFISDDIKNLAKKIIESSQKERLDLVGKFIKKYEEEEIHAYMRSDSTNLLNMIEKEYYEKSDPRQGGAGKNFSKDQIFLFDELIKVKNYLNDKGSSAKMLLEHIVLILPK